MRLFPHFLPVVCLTLLAGAGWLFADSDKSVRPERIAALVEQLGDDSFVRREMASKSLEAIGEPALSALVEALVASKDPEVRRRARRLILAVMPKSIKSKSIGLELMSIRASRFQMGSPKSEPYRRVEEALHPVQILRPFYMGAYEVTQDEYHRVMKARPSWFSPTGEGKDKVKGHATGRFPVENVSWFDAVEFCNRLGGLDGLKPYYKLTNVKRTRGSITSATVTTLGGSGYRLPTEAEWEYACRAGSIQSYHFGAISKSGDANMKSIISSGGYGSDTKWADLGRTAKVGSYPPNAWGLYDMHGNVAEWCADWYDKDYYGKSPSQDPRGPSEGKQRVLRGGSWLVSETSSRSASRFGQTPAEKEFYSGFRVVRNP